MIDVAYMNYGNNDKDDSGSEDIEGDEEDSFQSIITARRVDLENQEKDHNRQLLPRDNYVKVPFVAHLMSTNQFNRKEMVCFYSYILFL